jgi:uncharacterized SAM-binding protein YcdF (DUF218 family)
MRFLLSIVVIAAITWSAALVWFVQAMPQHSAAASIKTDAIIVLTGGSGRVERGLAMLADQAAPVLLISGVGQHVTLHQMLAAHTNQSVRQQILTREPASEIVLDYVAATTQSNAQLASEFVQQRQVKSVRLITAHYHMPRSLLEFEAAMPTLDIIADPVFPDGFQRDQWWRHDNTRHLVFSEFYKYFAALLLRKSA